MISGLTGRERTHCKSPALFEASLMPLQFRVKTDNAITRWEKRKKPKEKTRTIYLDFFFCMPAPGTALDRFIIEAAATATDGTMARFERLRPAARN